MHIYEEIDDLNQYRNEESTRDVVEKICNAGKGREFISALENVF